MPYGALTPIGAAARGIVAGAAGTAAMTGVQSAYYRATDSEASSTPAEVGKRITEGVLHREVPEEQMNVVSQGVHWLYGSSWGLPYGLAAGSRQTPGSVLAGGLGLGLLVWAASRTQMTVMQIAPPPWQDPPSSLAIDVGFHLVYGTAAALAFRLLR